MSIVNQAMICNISIGVWQGYRLDREASRQVTADNNAEGDAARVNKHLVPKEALAPITTASGAVRTHFYTKTLPWKDNGDRLLTRLMYMDFVQEHGALVQTFKDAVEDFLTTGYPAARDQAEFRMGDLFKPEDYPSVEALRSKFYVNMDIDPVSDVNDFRVQMEQSELDRVQASMEDAMKQRIGRAMSDVWSRLSDVVGHFATKMSEDGTFRVTTVTKIEELVDMLPGLNVLDDPDLKAMGEEIKARLVGYDPKNLRKDPEVRSQAAKDAQEIVDKMSGFMAAMGGAM